MNKKIPIEIIEENTHKNFTVIKTPIIAFFQKQIMNSTVFIKV